MNVPVVLLRRISAMLAFAIWNALAMADADMHLPTQIVSYADLNLSSAQGAAVLYRRITRAAEQVCGPAEQPGSRLPRPGYRECMVRAVSEAVSKVDRPELSAYHAQKQHRVPAATIASIKR